MIRQTLRLLAEADFRVPPPHIAEKLYPMFCSFIDDPDPYKKIKKEYNDLAMGLVPKLMAHVRGSPDPLRSLIRIALAGNIIDFGVAASFDLDGALERMLFHEPDVDEIDRFQARLEGAPKILYLADNAGEIVFDRLLVEHLVERPCRVTLAVRGGPIINDVTRQDAEYVGLSELVEVIDPGVATPGIALARSSQAFVKAFEEADLIVSKGQGNFESLDEYRDPRVFYIFMVKCRVVSALTKLPLKSCVAAFADRFEAC